MNWSPDGQYVAIGGAEISGGYQDSNYTLQIFQFSPTTGELIALVGEFNDTLAIIIESVNWSPDGQFIAVGGYNVSGGYQNSQFQVFQFNRTNNSLIPIAGNLYFNGSTDIWAVSWSPDGRYIAIGGEAISDGYENSYYQFQIFEFDRINNSLTPVAGSLYDDTETIIIYSVDWSPDGQYIAVGGNSISGGYGTDNQFQIFEFNRTDNSLTPVAGSIRDMSGDTYVFSANWSPDGQHLVLGGLGIVGGYKNSYYQLQIFDFNRTNNAHSLMPIAGSLYDRSGPVSIHSADWSSDGQYIALGGNGISGGYNDSDDQFQIFQFDSASNLLTPIAGTLYNSNQQTYVF